MSKPRQGTLVVCTAGMSRSATICIAYMMKYQQYTYEEALAKAKKARRYVNPNPGFVVFLKEFEKKLRQESSLQPTNSISQNRVAQKDDCELCQLQRRTQWFPDHSETPSTLIFPMFPQRVGDRNEFTILICEECDCPMIVYTGPLGHLQELNMV